MQQGKKNNVKAYILECKSIQIGKKEVQLYVFTDDTMLCVENPNEPIKSIRTNK